MYEWGWRTFESMFRRHLLRRAREELREMRDLRLAAIDANMNFDSQENARAKESRIESIQDAYKQGVRILYSNDEPEQEDPFEDDPLFNPLKRRAQVLKSEADQPLAPNAGAGRKLLEAY